MNEIPVTVTPTNPELRMEVVEPAAIPVELVPLLAPVAVAEALPTDPIAYYILAKG